MKKLWIAGLCLSIWSIQGYAGLFDDDEARRQITVLQKQSNERLQQLEMANQKMLDLVNQIAQMQNDIAELKGKFDELNYNLHHTQKQQQDLYVDLDSRIKSVERASTLAQESVENKLLNNAIASMHAKKYEEAKVNLQKFIATYPHSKSLGAAYYWLGMSQAAMRHFSDAHSSFNKVLTTFPEDIHAADAMLALASVQLSQGDKVASAQTLQNLITDYSTSTAAQQARRALIKK